MELVQNMCPETNIQYSSIYMYMYAYNAIKIIYLYITYSTKYIHVQMLQPLYPTLTTASLMYVTKL